MRRNYFEEELRKLIEEKYSAGDAKECIEQLKLDRYIDDERTLRGYIRYKALSGYGAYYIKEKLYHRGEIVSVDKIRDIIEEEEVDSSQILRDLALKYKRSRKKLDSYAFSQACIRYLSGRGFSMEESIKTLKEVENYESDFFEGC